MFTKYYRPVTNKKEICFYIEHSGLLDKNRLGELLGDLKSQPTLCDCIEYGPKGGLVTSWCSNTLSILHKCGFTGITRIEKAVRVAGAAAATVKIDEMTEEFYHQPLTSFNRDRQQPDPVKTVPRDQITQFNKEQSLGLDWADLEFIQDLFTDRDPSTVELFDIAQSNSEHSRHHFFNARLTIDGQEMPQTLFQLIKQTLPANSNSVLAFCDNASAIKGYQTESLLPANPSQASAYRSTRVNFCPSFTAETHNFPTGIAPFPGAATGVGGRARDTMAIGRGGNLIASTAGYCVANRQLLIDASNGASDYGNKLGEPIIGGFTRFYRQKHGDSYWGWKKPIMFSGGIGQVTTQHLKKEPPVPGMLIVRVGGPAYRIGMGGSSASSSHQTSGSNLQRAVQRGDPEMENRVNKFLRACIDLGEANPIVSIHDQGAGGAANVTKEIVLPLGGVINIDKIIAGDHSLNSLEKWVAEYQEQMTLLTKKENLQTLRTLAVRENVPLAIVGEITDNNHMVVLEKANKIVSLDLSKIFVTPQKTFTDNHQNYYSKPIPNNWNEISLIDAIKQVFSLESVHSKRFLTVKVDRSVTGLIAQQQCVGPLDTPLCDYSLVALSYYDTVGTASAIGEQPIKALLDPAEASRLAVTEMLTNIMWVKISSIEDIKCSVNWMWPAKLPGEAAAMYDAMVALCNYMSQLGIAADGGKDSLTMYAYEQQKLIKSPRSVVISGYVTVPDIRKQVTPDFKDDPGSCIYVVFLGDSHQLGGSTFLQSQSLLGDFSPKAPTAKTLLRIFNLVQNCIEQGLILAGHDCSDGGLITTILEMAIAGNMGCKLSIKSDSSMINYFFSESPAIVFQVAMNNKSSIESLFKGAAQLIGRVCSLPQVSIDYNYMTVLDEPLSKLRMFWERPSLALDLLQANPETVAAEGKYLETATFAYYSLPLLLPRFINTAIAPNVAILRDEGSNGEREMAAAFDMAGFTVWDITMSDLVNNPELLDQFRGIAFVGGFTYADVLGAANGWAATIRYNENLRQQFERFYKRENTFSFGVCNGCQLMSRLGWVPECKFIENISGRFESRFATVRISDSPAIMLCGLTGVTIGVWISHREGRYQGKLPESLTPIRYIDATSKPTEIYPFNPNGSANGVAAVCDASGRHLAMMPHPERCFLNWQMARLPPGYTSDYSPWFYLFQNAYEWCQQ